MTIWPKSILSNELASVKIVHRWWVPSLTPGPSSAAAAHDQRAQTNIAGFRLRIDGRFLSASNHPLLQATGSNGGHNTAVALTERPSTPGIPPRGERLPR